MCIRDRGLCGGFNENLLAAVDEHIYEHTSHGINVSIFMAGRKGWDHLAGKYKLLTKVDNINPEFGKSTAERVTKLFAQRYLNRESAGAFLVFNRFESAVLQRVTIWNYLPLYWRMPEKEYAADYIFEPEREELLNQIIEESLVRSVEQAFLESRAAELAARMTAMDSATKNAEDMISHLTLEYHKARQQAITMELLDIVGGAEALK
jgi:F-type H+-transporting ATPase subunit gamma